MKTTQALSNSMPKPHMAKYQRIGKADSSRAQYFTAILDG